MAVDKDQEDRDLTVREEHDGSAVVVFTDAVPAEDGAKAEKVADKQTGKVDDEDGDEDIKLTAAEEEGKSETEREEIRARRRAERQHRKQTRKDREEMQNRQLEAERLRTQQLEQRLAAIEQRNTGSELAQLEVAIKQAGDAYTYYKDQIAVAATANNGRGIAEATEKMMLARQRGEELVGVRNAYSEHQAKPAALDPRLLNHAQKWLDEHKWYDTNGRDEDSAIVRVLDDRVKADGFDPTTESYWVELSNRVKRRLPHRVGITDHDTATQARQTPSHVTGSDKSGSQTQAGGRFEFKLSANRVQAMRDAGSWDDPAKRAKAIKAYQKYDAEHKS